MNLVKYCETDLQRIRPCEGGWRVYMNDGSVTSCEDSCNHMVNKDTIKCPTCGHHLNTNEEENEDDRTG